MSEEADWDCVVIGAGPSGSSTARELARRGVRVLLVDKATFPRPKVCGCCVNPRALASLERLGLGDLPARDGAIRLTSMRVAAGGRQALVEGQDLGVCLSREAFDLGLVNAAIGAGATFAGGTVARLVGSDREEPVWRQVDLRGESGDRMVSARVVVAATGLVELGDELGPQRGGIQIRGGSKIGAGAWLEAAPMGYVQGRIEMACGSEGYVGAVVLEDGRLDLAAALRPAAVRAAGGIGRVAESIIRRAGLPEVPGIAGLPWKGTPYLTRRPLALAARRVYRIGDAAGYVEPFTGEGMAWALEGGLALAPILADVLRSNRDLASTRGEEAWGREYRERIRSRQAVCRIVAGVLSRHWLARVAIGALSRAPGLAPPVLRRIHAVPSDARALKVP